MELPQLKLNKQLYGRAVAWGGACANKGVFGPSIFCRKQSMLPRPIRPITIILASRIRRVMTTRTPRRNLSTRCNLILLGPRLIKFAMLSRKRLAAKRQPFLVAEGSNTMVPRRFFSLAVSVLAIGLTGCHGKSGKTPAAGVGIPRVGRKNSCLARNV